MIDLIKREDAKKALSKGEGCGNICCKAIDRIPAVTIIQQEANSNWDYFYEVACTIVQAFDENYPSPNVIEVIKALSFAASKCKTTSTEEIVKWAKDYCVKWFELNIKDGEHE